MKTFEATYEGEVPNMMACPACTALFFQETDPKCPRCLGTGTVCPICRGMGFVSVNGALRPCECGLVGRRLARDLAPISALRGRLLDASFSNFKLAGPASAATAAFNAAVHWAAKCEGWLTVWGPKGNGKTHLAAAAANEVIARNRAVIIINTPEFLNWLKQAFDIKEESAYDRIQKVRAVDVLVIDDLGVEYSKANNGRTSWAQEQLYLVLNYRYEMILPTFITTNVKIGQLEPRIRSRIQEFEVVHNPASDYRRGDGKVTDR